VFSGTLPSDAVGWGQVEMGTTPCGAIGAEIAVDFDLQMLRKISGIRIEAARLIYQEAEYPALLGSPKCALVNPPNGTPFTAEACWQSGGGGRENKPAGCTLHSVASVDWRTQPVSGMIPEVSTPGPTQSIKRISNTEWDVTTLVLGRINPPLTPPNSHLSNPYGYGFLIVSNGQPVNRLQAEDNTVCISQISNIQLRVTYTVPAFGEPGNQK